MAELRALNHWKAMITTAMASREGAVSVLTPLKPLRGISKPALVHCSDDRKYAVKGCQVGRALIADQVVGRLGAAMGAPVAEVGLVDVPQSLIDHALSPAGLSTLPLLTFSSGIGHGSIWIAGCMDSREVEYESEGENGIRFAQLAVLFGWAEADDRQFLYREQSPRLVYSVDHGHFFPGGPDWTVDSLAAAPPAEPDLMITKSAWVTTAAIQHAGGLLQGIDDELIAESVAVSPSSWGITLDERVALADYLARRRDQLLGTIGVS